MFNVSRTLIQSDAAWQMKGNDKNDVKKWIYATLKTIGAVIISRYKNYIIDEVKIW